ncbi:MAG: BREX system ATP-binding domain-containing protein [Micromonosporaceae bacterium]
MKSMAPADLVGRDAEVSALGALVSEVATGRGGVAWIEGEPGVGKSALVDVVSHMAMASGFTVLRAAADESTTPFPLRLAADCLEVSIRSSDTAKREIARLLRGEPLVGTFDPVIAAGERMVEVVDRAVSVGQVVLIFEDLHWADEASLQLWNRLARMVDQVPLVLVGTCRRVPIRPFVSRVKAMVSDRGGVVLDLEPLGHPDVELLASSLVAARVGARLSDALRRAGGNPLYVRELVKALLLDGLAEVADGEAELRADADWTPTSLTAAIEYRLGFLGVQTVEVLRLAALLGNECDVEELVTIVGCSPVELVNAIGEAVTAGVVDASGRRVAFRHDLIRQVLVEQLSTGMRAALHDSFAQQLAEAGGRPDRVARHLLAVPDRLAEWVPGWLASIPESMLYAAPQVSADLLSRAVAVLGHGDSRWEELACRLVQVLFWLGRDEQVLEVAAGMPGRATDVERAARMRLYIARSAGRTNRFDEVFAVLEPALADPRLPIGWRARLSAWFALGLAYVSRDDEAQAMAERALAEARSCGDALAAGYALHALQTVFLTDRRYTEEALECLGDDPESMDLRIMLECKQVVALSDDGRQVAARQRAREALVLAERIGTYRSASVVVTTAELNFDHGDWDEALVHMASVAPEFADTDHVRDGYGLAATIALRRGEPEQAMAHLLAAGVSQPVETTERDYLAPTVVAAVALIAEAAGDVERALKVRASWLDLPALWQRSSDCVHALDLVRAALAAEDTATARAAVDALRRHAGQASTLLTLVERSCRAMLGNDAADLLAVAAEFRGHGWTPYAGFALEEAAARLAAAGEIAPARRALTDAVRIYADLGAAWDIRRVDARLRPFGVRRGPRSLNRRPRIGWDALTQSERRVAGLVAKGRSNPDIAAELFLSRNTVQTHVSNILSKLQLRSRLELIREATEQAQRSSR